MSLFGLHGKEYLLTPLVTLASDWLKVSANTTGSV
jgi:hypothetical protein